MTILDQFADYVRERTEQAKRKIPLYEIKNRRYLFPGKFSL